MWAARGMKLLSMNEASSSSLYDSASSRAHPPHAGAALKSISSGFFPSFASASAPSASFLQCTFIKSLPPVVKSQPHKLASVLRLLLILRQPFANYEPTDEDRSKSLST